MKVLTQTSISPSRSLKAETVLALETSCDETAVAVVCSRRGILASEIASQIAIHRVYGGVVPEVASRHHLPQLRPLVEVALEKAGVALESIDAVAATAGPGLATSLMLGMSVAKGLAVGLGKPFLAINHLEGHLLSPFFSPFKGSEAGLPEIPPSIGLVVSGGHTLLIEIERYGRYTLLGQTRDDAAGEAFDKVGKLLGLPYPGGPVIDRLAQEGDPKKYRFPRSMLGSGDLHFSFSGLKTSVRYLLPTLPPERRLEDLCASFQEAVVDVLVGKALAAARQSGKKVIAVSGGVSCNRRLREKMAGACGKEGVRLLLADPGLSTDNAAMIALVALYQASEKGASPLMVDVDPNLGLV